MLYVYFWSSVNQFWSIQNLQQVNHYFFNYFREGIISNGKLNFKNRLVTSDWLLFLLTNNFWTSDNRFLNQIFIRAIIHVDYFVSDNDQLFLGKYPIPRKTPDPININTKKVHQVKLPPLHLLGILFALTKLSNTGKSGRYLHKHLQITHKDA